MGLLPTKAVALLGSDEWPNNEAEAGTSRKGVNELDPNASVTVHLPAACKLSPLLWAPQPRPGPALAHNGLVGASPPPLPFQPLRKKLVNKIFKNHTT